MQERKRSTSRSFNVALIPAVLAAAVMAGVASLAPSTGFHGLDSRWVIGASLVIPGFFLVLFISFLVLVADLRLRTAVLFGALVACPLAYLLGVKSPLVDNASWSALYVASMLVVFPACALLAWRLRFRRVS